MTSIPFKICILFLMINDHAIDFALANAIRTSSGDKESANPKSVMPDKSIMGSSGIDIGNNGGVVADLSSQLTITQPPAATIDPETSRQIIQDILSEVIHIVPANPDQSSKFLGDQHSAFGTGLGSIGDQSASKSLGPIGALLPYLSKLSTPIARLIVSHGQPSVDDIDQLLKAVPDVAMVLGLAVKGAIDMHNLTLANLTSIISDQGPKMGTNSKMEQINNQSVINSTLATNPAMIDSDGHQSISDHHSVTNGSSDDHSQKNRSDNSPASKRSITGKSANDQSPIDKSISNQLPPAWFKFGPQHIDTRPDQNIDQSNQKSKSKIDLDQEQPNDYSTIIWIVIGVGIALLIIVIVLVLVCILRRQRNRRLANQQISENGTATRPTRISPKSIFGQSSVINADETAMRQNRLNTEIEAGYGGHGRIDQVRMWE